MKSVLLALSLLVALPAAGQAPDFTALAQETGAAVVRVSGVAHSSPEPQSLGSGFVIEASGYIVTNAHLVAHTQDIVVRFADRRELDARLVGYDRASDIALLKVEAAGLAAARTAPPRTLRAGEWVAAIGAPFGLERSVTAGIVSAVDRVLPEAAFVPFIQTDVAVNPGNSGGPLLNLRGEVVGVNSGFYSETGTYAGVSFAVPIDVAMEVAGQLRAHGRVTRGVIGVRLQEVTGELARALMLPEPAGALVLEVGRGGAADRAAIRAGDVIVRFDGQPVESDAHLVRIVGATAPGRTVELQLLRFGAPLTAQVHVDEARAPPMPPALRPDEPLGLFAIPLTPRQRERLRVDGGLVVERTGTAGRRAGLARGDVILSVNGKSVATMADFRRLIEGAGRGATVALLVQREDVRQFLPLRVPR